MKSTLYWISGVLIGAALGYGVSHVFNLNMYFLIVAGAIIGSSATIASNIQRSKEVHFPIGEEDEEGDDGTIS